LVRDFLAEFRGLSGTVTRRAVLEATEGSRKYLADFFPNDRADHDAMTQLLVAMKEHSKPVKPEYLGVIGADELQIDVAETGAFDITANAASTLVCPMLSKQRSRTSLVRSVSFTPASISARRFLIHSRSSGFSGSSRF